jgi:DOPA 4,5-dioxygenase
VSWLQLNSRGLSILVHPHTGDEAKDHLEFAIWLGRQLPLNDAFFKVS